MKEKKTLTLTPQFPALDVTDVRGRDCVADAANAKIDEAALNLTRNRFVCPNRIVSPSHIAMA